uniref:Uncharacterized protein n=1 Tax=Nelumbo nucifera TaxID=4432 RepID=A0A822Y6U4_NELNU|nr:TPA_asm: hypothetical protein HUJ06_028354 [Nelumbo nucifera]
MLYSNGVGTNPRKIGREAIAAAAAAGAPIGLFSLQSQTPPTLVNLGTLHNSITNKATTQCHSNSRVWFFPLRLSHPS